MKDWKDAIAENDVSVKINLEIIRILKKMTTLLGGYTHHATVR